jgi:phospholipid/cholesterol/gamma-HCH transport system substrate-binding protein
MQQSLQWSSLKAGLLVLLGLGILGAAIFAVGNKGGIFSDNYRLTTRFPEVQGLKSAAPVWLAGVEVGSVSSIQFVQDGARPIIEVHLNIDRRFQHLIRQDSVATIGGKGLLGDKIIAVTLGTQAAEAIPDNGRLPGEAPMDWSTLIDEATVTVRNFGDIVSNFRHVSEDINEGKGSFGKLVKDESLYDNLNGVVVSLAELTNSLQKGDGSLAKLMNDPALYDEVNLLVKEVRSGNGSLAKLINDPALYDGSRDSIAQLQTTLGRVDVIVAKLERGEGSVGKMMGDEDLHVSMDDTLKELRALIADIKENPGRYIKLKIF